MTTTSQPEVVTISGEQCDAYVCECGNDVMSWGFYPCLPNGAQVAPTIDNWDEPLYQCDKCGAIHAVIEED